MLERLGRAIQSITQNHTVPVDHTGHCHWSLTDSDTALSAQAQSDSHIIAIDTVDRVATEHTAAIHLVVNVVRILVIMCKKYTHFSP